MQEHSWQWTTTSRTEQYSLRPDPGCLAVTQTPSSRPECSLAHHTSPNSTGTLSFPRRASGGGSGRRPAPLPRLARPGVRARASIALTTQNVDTFLSSTISGADEPGNVSDLSSDAAATGECPSCTAGFRRRCLRGLSCTGRASACELR